MERELLFTGSKWDILMELAKRPRSTSELAERLRTSQPNVSQQLRQLELAGIVKRERTTRKGIHYTYSIAQDYLYIVHLTPTSANKKTLKQNPYERFLAGLLLHRHGLALLGIAVGKPDVFTKLGAVGVLERDQPELFAITDEIEVPLLRLGRRFPADARGRRPQTAPIARSTS